MCIKYESNTLIFPKEIEQKPILLHTDGRTYVQTAVILFAHPPPPPPPPTENGGGIKQCGFEKGLQIWV